MGEVVMHPPIFETDGFRELVTNDTNPLRINELSVARVADAHIEVQLGEGANDLCVTGRDTRPSGRALEVEVIAGASHAGARVISLGEAATPAILWTAKDLNAGSAIVLTASHNTQEYNGIKCTKGPDKPSPEEAAKIDEAYWRRVDAGVTIPPIAHQVEERPELVEKYKLAVVEDIESKFGEQPLKDKIFVVDGANGVASKMTPDILRRLGATVEEFACDPSKPINEGCGAGDLSGVKKYLSQNPELVQNPNFVGALANDGDADRLMAVGAKVVDGKVVTKVLDGNHLLELFSEGEHKVVSTLYVNGATIHRLEERGVEVGICDNGDTSVTKALRDEDLRIGTEFTGHVVDREWLSSGDGIRSAAWLASYAAKNNTNFFEIAESMPLWPERMIKLKLGRNNVGEHKRSDVLSQIEAAEAELAGNGRFVVRASGTEKGIYRVWGVGQDEAQINQLTQSIADTMAFPSTFADRLAQVAIEDLDQDGKEALSQLQESGYEAFTGLRPDDLPEVAEIADQDQVFKYCRRDVEERFGGINTPQETRIDMATEWQKKMRLFFQLRRKVGQAGLAGYGWTGPEKPGELPTFAVRVNELDAGRGIGTLLTRVIVSATRMRTKSEIRLETWAAEKTYIKAGAVRIGDPVPGRRPAGRDETPGPDGKVEDTRVFMAFPAPTAK